MGAGDPIHPEVVSTYIDDCKQRWEHYETDRKDQSSINDSTKVKIASVMERVAMLTEHRDKTDTRLSSLEVGMGSIPQRLESGMKRFDRQDETIKELREKDLAAVAKRVGDLEPKRTPLHVTIATAGTILTICGIVATAFYDRPTHAEVAGQIAPLAAAQKQIEAEFSANQLQILLKLQEHSSALKQLEQGIESLKKQYESAPPHRGRGE